MGKLSGAYLGNAFASENCLGLATNRYDQQIVTASSRSLDPLNTGSDYICHIVMLNAQHEVKWSREFGNTLGGNRDLCPDAAISKDGLIVYVIGHAYDFTTLTSPVGTTDFYILQMKINDGTLMKQKVIAGNDQDYFRAIKFHRNTLYILGDTLSIFKYNAGTPPVLLRSATFIMKTNCDLVEFDCLKNDYLGTKQPLFANNGEW